MSDAIQLHPGDTPPPHPPGEMTSQDPSSHPPPAPCAMASHTEECVKGQPMLQDKCSDLKEEPGQSHVLKPAGPSLNGKHPTEGLCSLNGTRTTTSPAIFEDISLDEMTCTSGKEPPSKTLASQELPVAIFEDISMDGLGQQKPENHSEGTQFNFSTVISLETKSSAASEHSSNGTQAIPPIQCQSRRRKRKRKRDYVMEHSGLESSLGKRMNVAIQAEAMPCLKPSGINMDSTPEMVARELVKCMHEPKYELLKDVIKVLGVERTMELFEETYKIQENGGQLAANGGHKRSPGGVFFTLVKKTATADQNKEMFKRDKEIRLQRLKEAKRRKKVREHIERTKMEQQLLQEKADRQLDVFRAQLSPSSVPPVILGDRRDRNMEKRLSGTLAPELPRGEQKGSVFERLGHKPAGSTGEAMEVDSIGHRGREDVEELDEQKLAEEFEQMNDCDLDFGIVLS